MVVVCIAHVYFTLEFHSSSKTIFFYLIKVLPSRCFCGLRPITGFSGPSLLDSDQQQNYCEFDNVDYVLTNI